MVEYRKIKKPMIGVLSHVKPMGKWDSSYAHRKYITPLNRCDLCALIIPYHDDPSFYRGIADRLDGFLLTGAHSNVFPSRYGGKEDDKYGPFDSNRDLVSFTIIEEALKQQKPILGICRGFQDMNVFMGGTLHQYLPDITDVKHHVITYDDIHEVYKNRHEIDIKEDSKLFEIMGEKQINVNSVHKQGIDKLGSGLTANAKAEDGIIECITFDDHNNFAMGVQWHPEYDFSYDKYSKRVFQSFSETIYQTIE
ncbi:MAG: hypothetical protein CMP22_01290 [Rickettsiales bacterium]|nr:hypothetical protein [Rickettsiales bacterium]|tara:strand:- start:18 stop:773 length:756 start_codon:yes stop_codon:yes gene_type:complete